MVDVEQVKPLAQNTEGRLSSDDDETASHLLKIRRSKYIKCCGCITALFLILAIVIVILIFTVFRIKDPRIKLNGFTIVRLELNGTIPKAGVNITMLADISVKNPNLASFKYSNTTTSLYYRGDLVGEARGPPGQAKARRTMRMNVTVDVITDRLMSNPNLLSDSGSGLLTMDSYSRIGGRVNIFNIFKRHVIVMMNCSMTVNILSQEIHEQKCRRKVDL